MNSVGVPSYLLWFWHCSFFCFFLSPLLLNVDFPLMFPFALLQLLLSCFWCLHMPFSHFLPGDMDSVRVPPVCSDFDTVLLFSISIALEFYLPITVLISSSSASIILVLMSSYVFFTYSSRGYGFCWGPFCLLWFWLCTFFFYLRCSLMLASHYCFNFFFFSASIYLVFDVVICLFHISFPGIWILLGSLMFALISTL